MSYAEAQIDRILANLVRFGRVKTVDYASAECSVDFDGELVDGVEWLKSRAGDDRTWTAPSVGEYVVVLSASGDLSQGVILGSLAQSNFPNAGKAAHLWAVDRGITKTYVNDVVEGVNAYLRSITNGGAILGGKCWADPDLNTTDVIKSGKIYFDYDFTPVYPAEHITFRSHLVDDYIKEIFS